MIQPIRTCLWQWRGRAFTSTPLERLQDILDKYQKDNYTQALPSRFIKEVVKAADENKDGMIDVDEVQHLLSNIGSRDQLSRDEIESLIHKYFGPDASQVPVDVVIQRFLENRAKTKK